MGRWTPHAGWLFLVGCRCVVADSRAAMLAVQSWRTATLNAVGDELVTRRWSSFTVCRAPRKTGTLSSKYVPSSLIIRSYLNQGRVWTETGAREPWSQTSHGWHNFGHYGANAVLCSHRHNLQGVRGVLVPPTFWTEGYRTPTFQDENVKNLLSPASAEAICGD